MPVDSSTSKRLRRQRLWLQERPRERRPRRKWFYVGAVATVAALVALTPWILARPAVFNRLLAWGAADLDGQISVRSASLGWFSGQVLRGLEVTGPDKRPFVRVTKVEIDSGLLALAKGRLGKITLQSPEVTLVLAADRSNAEQILAAYLAEDEKTDGHDSSGGAGAGLDLQVTDGRLTVIDEPRSQDWRFNNLAATATLPADAATPGKLQATAELASGGAPATAQLDATFNRPEGADGYTGQCQLKATNVPIELTSWWLDRASPGTQASGRVAAELSCDFAAATKDRPATARVDGQLAAENLLVTAPWLGHDQLRLARLTAPCQLRRAGDQLNIEQLGVHCDLGHVAYTGGLDLGRGVVESLTTQAYEVTGELDLARLAQMLPETVRVRQGTEIKAGGVTLRLASAQKDGAPTWNGNITASNLVAESAGRPITWQQPLTAVFSARQTDRGLYVDQLRCQASFLQVQAGGQPDDFSVSAEYNLKQLAQELNQFFDLGQAELAGDGWSYFKWQRDAQNRFDVSVETQLRNLVVALPDRRAWREENLVLLSSASGTATGLSQWASVQDADLRIDAKLDRGEARLLAPITPVGWKTVWPLEVQARGQIAQWLPRLGPFVSALDGWDISGQGQLRGRMDVSADTLALVGTELNLANLHAWGHGWYIDEPQVNLKVQGNLNAPQSLAQIDDLQLVSQAVSVIVRDFKASVPATGPSSLNGAVSYRADVPSLLRWQRDPAVPPAVAWYGQVQGQGQIARTAQDMQASLQTTVLGLAAVKEGKELWREKQLDLSGQLNYNAQADALRLDKLDIQSQGLALSTRGSIDSLSGARRLDLSGKLDYDMAALAALAGSYLGSDVQLTGRQSRNFAVRGPLKAYTARPTNLAPGAAPPAEPAFSLLALTGDAALGWDSGNLYGFGLGPGELQARLLEGKLHLDLLNVPVSGGKLSARPVITLEPEPMQLQVEAGKIIDHVRISPEMCNRVLMYIAPVMADVGSAQGQFSIDLEGCRVPLADAKQADVAGKMTVHSVEVSAGPLVEALSVVLQRQSTASLQRESIVPFRMVQGRIYHRDLQLVFPELTIRTYGSVGLDRTLAIMAEMPVPPKWIGNNPLGAALQNQVIQLPIGGTLNQPVIDQQALQQASAKFLQNAAGDVLKNELNNQLDRLLRPRP